MSLLNWVLLNLHIVSYDSLELHLNLIAGTIVVILNKPLFSFSMQNNSFDVFLIFFVHKTQCVNFKFHIYNKTLLGLEILCHIVYLLSLIFWFSMWRVCLRNFCHDFIIYKLLLLLCHILFEVLQQNFIVYQFYFAYISTIPYTCADPEIFLREIQDLLR